MKRAKPNGSNGKERVVGRVQFEEMRKIMEELRKAKIAMWVS